MAIKKSGFEDAFFFITVVFTICIFVLVLAKVWDDAKTPMADSIQKTMGANSSVNATETFDKVSDTINLFNKLVPLIIIGLFAFVFIGVAIYIQHPIMLFVGIIVLGVAILLAMIYSNIYTSMIESDNFSEQAASLTIQNEFMEFLPYIVIILFVGIVALIIYSRQGGSSSL